MLTDIENLLYPEYTNKYGKVLSEIEFYKLKKAKGKEKQTLLKDVITKHNVATEIPLNRRQNMDRSGAMDIAKKYNLGYDQFTDLFPQFGMKYEQYIDCVGCSKNCPFNYDCKNTLNKPTLTYPQDVQGINQQTQINEDADIKAAKEAIKQIQIIATKYNEDFEYYSKQMVEYDQKMYAIQKNEIIWLPMLFEWGLDVDARISNYLRDNNYDNDYWIIKKQNVTKINEPFHVVYQMTATRSLKGQEYFTKELMKLQPKPPQPVRLPDFNLIECKNLIDIKGNISNSNINQLASCVNQVQKNRLDDKNKKQDIVNPIIPTPAIQPSTPAIQPSTQPQIISPAPIIQPPIKYDEPKTEEDNTLMYVTIGTIAIVGGLLLFKKKT